MLPGINPALTDIEAAILIRITINHAIFIGIIGKAHKRINDHWIKRDIAGIGNSNGIADHIASGIGNVV